MSNLKTILKSFNFKEELNPKFWIKKDSTYILRPQIREKLLQIAYEFLDSLDVDVIISDVTFTGSLCNFNWSNYSDVDLHLKTDYNQFHKDDVPLYEELFDLKTTIFSEKHDITMYGYDVELYVEDENQKKTENAGVYSILQNEWVVEPKKEKKTVDKTSVIKKSKSWMKQIDTAIDLAKEESLDDAKKIIKRIRTKIAKYRTCGLQKGGEFSVENLVFKVLRRSGYIEKIKNLKNELIDKNLSLKEQSVKDPELETSEKAEYVEPDVKKFYEELEGINSNIDQQQSGSYTYQKDVETFQIALDILGYKLPRYGVDGKFGPETAKAVNDFKKDNGLKLTESIKRKRLVEADIAGIDELVYNPVTGKDGTIGYGFDSEKRIPSISWKNHDTHLHIGFTNRDVAIAVMDKAKELGLSPAENLYTGKVNPVHTNNSFHYRVFDGEPAVSAGVDIWDVNGKKRDELNKLIQWIYDNYENKSTQKTPVVGYGGTNIGSYKIGSLFNAASQALDSFKKSNSFVSPEMAKKLVEKLKEKNITSSDIQKYTKIQMDFNDVVAKSDEEFYKEILRKIGAPTSESNLRFMYAWGKAESSRAKFNPISTTWDLDADSNISPFNCKNFKNKEVEPPVNNKCKPGFSSLVKNYSTPQYGIEATVKTLLSSKQDYSCIVNGLKNELPPDEIAKCESLEKWGTGDLVGKVLKSEKFTVPKIQGFS